MPKQCRQFDTDSNGKKSYNNLKQRVGIFIDLENKHRMVQELLNVLELNDNIIIYAYASKEHPSMIKLDEMMKLAQFVHYNKNVMLVKVPSTRRDAADVYLTMNVGGFITRNDYDVYIVVTNDHFGDTLCDCIPKPYMAYCCRTVDSIVNVFDKLI